MRMRKMPSYNRGRDIVVRNTHIGRLVCDVYLSARELVSGLGLGPGLGLGLGSRLGLGLEVLANR